MPKGAVALRRASFVVSAEMVINAFISLLGRASHFRKIQVEAITSMIIKKPNTRWLILSQNQLEEMAESAPDKASLVEQLIKHHDSSPAKGYSYIFCGQRPDEKPFFTRMGSSLDETFLTALKDAVDNITRGGADDDEKERYISRAFSSSYSGLVALVKAAAVHGVEAEAYRHTAIGPFVDLEADESDELESLLEDARDRAENKELSALQLFAEGKLEKLMPGDPRMTAFNSLPDHKKESARRQVIGQAGLGDYYEA